MGLHDNNLMGALVTMRPHDVIYFHVIPWGRMGNTRGLFESFTPGTIRRHDQEMTRIMRLHGAQWTAMGREGNANSHAIKRKTERT